MFVYPARLGNNFSRRPSLHSTSFGGLKALSLPDHLRLRFPPGPSSQPTSKNPSLLGETLCRPIRELAIRARPASMVGQESARRALESKPMEQSTSSTPRLESRGLS